MRTLFRMAIVHFDAFRSVKIALFTFFAKYAFLHQISKNRTTQMVLGHIFDMKTVIHCNEKWVLYKRTSLTATVYLCKI